MNETIELNLTGATSPASWLRLGTDFAKITQSKSSSPFLAQSDFLKPAVVEAFKIFSQTMLNIGTWIAKESVREAKITNGMQQAFAAHPDGMFRLLEVFALPNTKIDRCIEAADETIASDCMFGTTRRQARFWAGAYRLFKYAQQKQKAEAEGTEIPLGPDSPLVAEGVELLEQFLGNEGKIIGQQGDIMIPAFGHGQRWDLVFHCYDRLIQQGGNKKKWLGLIELNAKKRNAPPEVFSQLELLKALSTPIETPAKETGQTPGDEQRR